jgi:hypothetical protein
MQMAGREGGRRSDHATEQRGQELHGEAAGVDGGMNVRSEAPGARESTAEAGDHGSLASGFRWNRGISSVLSAPSMEHARDGTGAAADSCADVRERQRGRSTAVY